MYRVMVLAPAQRLIHCMQINKHGPVCLDNLSMTFLPKHELWGPRSCLAPKCHGARPFPWNSFCCLFKRGKVRLKTSRSFYWLKASDLEVLSTKRKHYFKLWSWHALANHVRLCIQVCCKGRPYWVRNLQNSMLACWEWQDTSEKTVICSL